jgi:cell wall-associated NlpC family hydrolase
MSFNVDVSDLIQVPFVEGGRDKNGMDCQGLFIEVMSRFGNKIVDIKPENFTTRHMGRLILIQIMNGQWLSLQEPPQPGDAVAMALDPMAPNTIQHLGVYLGEGQFIHILKATKVLISRIDDRYFSRKIKGFYRWKN